MSPRNNLTLINILVIITNGTLNLLFYSLRFKCQYRYYELLALQLAKKENIAEIVGFYGAKIKGKNAYIFMEYMTGNDN